MSWAVLSNVIVGWKVASPRPTSPLLNWMGVSPGVYSS